MLQLCVSLLRWLQFTGAMILFGSSLFLLYGLPASGEGSAGSLRWPKRLLLACAAAVLVGCVLGFVAQTAVLAGSVPEALTRDAMGGAMTMGFGVSSLVRAIAAGVVMMALALIVPARFALSLAACAGALICATFAWMGHGAATEGQWGLLHLSSDVVHSLAAGLWVGALVVFLILLFTNGQSGEQLTTVNCALHRFSGVGSALVAVIVATGLINGAFVIGVAGIPRLWASTYGQLFTFKLLLFLAMVGLAAANRFWLAPRLGVALEVEGSTNAAVLALRRSLAAETAMSIAVLALVAWFGTLAPPGV